MWQEIWAGSLLLNVGICLYLAPLLIRKGRKQENYPKTNFGYSFVPALFGWFSELLYIFYPGLPIFRLMTGFFLSVTVGINYSVFLHFTYKNEKVLDALRLIGIPFGLLVVFLQNAYYAIPLTSVFSVPYALMIINVMAKTIRSNPKSKFILAASLMSVLAALLIVIGFDINNLIPLSAIWNMLLFWAFFK